MLYRHNNQPTVVQCILCGQYILAYRFLRNSGYLFEHKVLSTFGVRFQPKEVLRNLKIMKFAQYVFADRFLRNSGYLFESEVLSTFGCQFLSKRSLEKSENTEMYLNLT